MRLGRSSHSRPPKGKLVAVEGQLVVLNKGLPCIAAIDYVNCAAEGA